MKNICKCQLEKRKASKGNLLRSKKHFKQRSTSQSDTNKDSSLFRSVKLNKTRNNSTVNIFSILDTEKALKSSVSIPKHSEAFIKKIGLKKANLSSILKKKPLPHASRSNRVLKAKTPQLKPKRRKTSKKNVPTKQLVTES